MFEYKYKIPKVELKTTFGSVCIRNIIFDPSEIEKALPAIVFNDENLMHMFAEDDLNTVRFLICRGEIIERIWGTY